MPNSDIPPSPTPQQPRLSPDQLQLVELRLSNERKSAGVAYAFWFVLGLLSAHRFYLGRPGTAILQILSYFILVGFVWWIVDAFLIGDMIRKDTAKRREDMIAALLSPTPY